MSGQRPCWATLCDFPCQGIFNANVVHTGPLSLSPLFEMARHPIHYPRIRGTNGMLMRSFLSSSFVVQFEQIVLLFIHYNIWWPLFAFVGGNSKLIFVLKYYAMLMSLEGFPADATSSHDMLLMSWARCVVSCLYWFVQTFNYFQSHLRIWVTTVKPAVRFQNISYVNSAIKVCC